MVENANSVEYSTILKQKHIQDNTLKLACYFLLLLNFIVSSFIRLSDRKFYKSEKKVALKWQPDTCCFSITALKKKYVGYRCEIMYDCANIQCNCAKRGEILQV